MELKQDAIEVYHNLYKDRYGIRPSTDFSTFTLAEVEVEIEALEEAFPFNEIEVEVPEAILNPTSGEGWALA
tara:strand:- start:79 stop:294 length:216 start_codon:yes stop_codon:yes gene_type:complete